MPNTASFSSFDKTISVCHLTSLELIAASRRVLCLITLLLALGRLAVASAYRALLLPASAAANLTQRPSTLLLVTDTASFSTCQSAPLAPPLYYNDTPPCAAPRRAASLPCPVLS